MKITRRQLRSLINEEINSIKEEEDSNTPWVDKTSPWKEFRSVVPDEDQAAMMRINQKIADADPTGIAQAAIDAGKTYGKYGFEQVIDDAPTATLRALGKAFKEAAHQVKLFDDYWADGVANGLVNVGDEMIKKSHLDEIKVSKINPRTTILKDNNMKRMINENISQKAFKLINWLTQQDISRKDALDAVEQWQAREGEPSITSLSFFIVKNVDQHDAWKGALSAMDDFHHSTKGDGVVPGLLNFFDDLWTLPQPNGYGKKLADDSAGSEPMAQQDENIRATIQELIKEIKQESGSQKVGSSPSEPKHLSEARMHVRKAINEMMVGLTPITRIDTQRDANNANRGNNTNTGVNKAEIGFNTFDMHEWASIAGITENTGLSEHWADDGYGSNVVDLRNPMSDESHEIPGMISPEQPMPAPCDGGCGEGPCGCHSEAGPVTGDVGHSDEVGNMDMDFERFLSGLEAEDAAGATRIGAAAVEGDEYYNDEHGELDGEPEFSFTGDVGELDGDSAFAIGIEAGKRGLDDEEPRKPRG
jgi:hypothetical protein